MIEAGSVRNSVGHKNKLIKFMLRETKNCKPKTILMRGYGQMFGNFIPDTLHRQGTGKTSLTVYINQGRGVGQRTQERGLRQFRTSGIFQDIDIFHRHPSRKGLFQGQGQGFGL